MSVGFDIGNGETNLAVCDDTGRPEVVATESGAKSWPTYAYKDGGAKVSAGEDARQQGICQPANLAYGYKMHLGDKTLRYFGGTASSSDVVGMVLPIYVAQAEKKTGRKITRGVVTCPAVFTDDQKQGLLDGFAKGGIEVLALIAEPEAAAYAYICKDKPGVGRTSIYVCIDWGHGTLDVTVLEVKDGFAKAIWTEGILQLGGRDFTDALKKIALEKVSKATGKVIALDKLDPMQAGELHEKVEKAKHALSGQPSTKIALNFGGKSQLVEITQAEYQAACASFVVRMKECVDKAMKGAKKEWKDVEKLPLAGGTFLAPWLQESVAVHTGLVPRVEIDPSSVVSFGAAIYAYHLEREKDGKGALGDQIVLTPTTRHDVGVCMIDKSSGTRKNLCWCMVSQGTEVPHKFTDHFKLERPNQTDVIIEILQGKHQAPANECLKIGTIHLSGLPAEVHLTDRIEITFSFDSNTLVTVTATDKISGVSKTVSMKVNDKKAA